MRNYPDRLNSIGSAVSEILWYRQTDRQTHILLLYYKDKYYFLFQYCWWLPSSRPTWALNILSLTWQWTQQSSWQWPPSLFQICPDYLRLTTSRLVFTYFKCWIQVSINIYCWVSKFYNSIHLFQKKKKKRLLENKNIQKISQKSQYSLFRNKIYKFKV